MKMADVEDLVHYIRCLKAGFDVDEFKSKLEELGEVVEGQGIDYENFHILFKVWLNLAIAVTKWKSIGECVIPQERIKPHTVNYALRWLLSRYRDQTSFTRIAFVLDWLTASMDTESIDMDTLNYGYEVFYSIFHINVLAPHVLKLLYVLSTPTDVDRQKVLNLIKLAKMREDKKSDLRGVQVLLGLFKSYKPELVPENVPAVPTNSCFKKINPTILHRFKTNQIRRNLSTEKSLWLQWANPKTMGDHDRRKYLPPLIPNMSLAHVGSKRYAEGEHQKTYLDFTNPASLLAYGSRYELSRPARLRSLLLQDAAVPLLLAAPHYHAFLDHELRYMLSYCFLQDYPYKSEEKSDLLVQLAKFQRTAQQGIPAVTSFLAQYLPFWNEMNFFSEMLNLVEWICVEPIDNMVSIVNTLGKIFLRAQPLHQLAILRTLTNMYNNLASLGTREKQYFLNTEVPQSLPRVTYELSEYIDNLCQSALQVNPEDLRILWATTEALQCKGRSALRYGAPVSNPHRTVCALALVTPSALLLDKLAGLLLTYWKMLSQQREVSDEFLPELRACTVDAINCLWEGRALSKRAEGVAFNTIPEELADVLIKKLNADQSFSLGSHLGLAPYSYVLFGNKNFDRYDNEAKFKFVVAQHFPSLNKFLSKTIDIEG